MSESNRERAVRAAVELVGTQGVRALTHRRVDERAGLPAGSTSNYFRTRTALFEGIVDAMLAAELPEVGPAFAPRDAQELLDALVRVFGFLTGPNRVMTAARLALFVEAGHDEAMRAALARGRGEIDRLVAPAFATLGAGDLRLAAQALAITFQGMLLHAVAGHAEVDVRGVLDLVISAALGPTETSGRGHATRGRSASGS